MSHPWAFALQPAEVGVGQSGGGVGGRLGGESVGLLGGADPTGDGIGVDGEDGGHGLARSPVGGGAHRLPAAFQFGGGSGWSTHDRLEGRRAKKEIGRREKTARFSARRSGTIFR